MVAAPPWNSKAIAVPPIRINEVVLGKRAVSADTALRLGKYFGTTAQFWMNLQTGHELELAKDKAGDSLRKLVPLKKAG
ncbi:MAG: HigA family addiction module antidote protein [Nitrospinae bacterium]|nr:HigA family addiction module antidote protein [Nitrospinota bacterium]